MFKADRLLAFIKNVASYFSNTATGDQLGQLQSIIQTVAAVGTLLENYDGLMLGAKLTKVAAATATATTTVNTTAAEANTTTTTATTNTTADKLIQGLGGLLKK